MSTELLWPNLRAMKSTINLSCEAYIPFMINGKRTYQWVEKPVAELLRYWQRPETRCPECKGSVRLHVMSIDKQMPEHFEHLENNPDCKHSYTFGANNK